MLSKTFTVSTIRYREVELAHCPPLVLTDDCEVNFWNEIQARKDGGRQFTYTSRDIFLSKLITLISAVYKTPKNKTFDENETRLAAVAAIMSGKDGYLRALASGHVPPVTKANREFIISVSITDL